MKEPFDFQALVRDYGWDVAEKARADWNRAYQQRLRNEHEAEGPRRCVTWDSEGCHCEFLGGGWRRIFRGAEGGK
jgi:hypothetical protein